MDFDTYCSLLKKGSLNNVPFFNRGTYYLNQAQILTSYGITTADLNILKEKFKDLLVIRISHYEKIVDSKVEKLNHLVLLGPMNVSAKVGILKFNIETRLVRQNNNPTLLIQDLRDFYHYFYYYYYFKSRFLLIERNALDCSRHNNLKEQLEDLVDPNVTDTTLDWLINNLDTYSDLRNEADYHYSDRSVLKLQDLHVFNQALVDLNFLKGV